jgi:hypothetical protein
VSAAGGAFVRVSAARDELDAEMIRGLLQSAGIPGFKRGGSIVVREEHAEEARAVLAETLLASEREDLPEPVNARYLAQAEGRSPARRGRGGAAGAYARMYLWGFGLMVLAFAVFLLVRAL